MTAHLYEINKNPFPMKVLIAIVAVFLLINAMVAHYWIGRYSADTTTEYKQGHNTVYSYVEGEITVANMEWIVSEKRRLNELILSGKYPTEEGQAGTYTGYVYSDNNLIDELYSHAKYTFEYESYAETVSTEAKANALLYAEKGNTNLASRYHLMSGAFSGRKILGFYRTNGWEKYFTYEFSNLLVLLLVIVYVSSLFSQERETGMDILLRITPSGLSRSRIGKIVVGFVYAWLINTLFSVQDLCIFSAAYNFRGFDNPIYSIDAFENTPLNVSIWGYLCINYVTKVFGIWTFSALVLLISAASSNNVVSFIGSLFLLIVEILVGSFAPYLSVLQLLNSIKLCVDFDGVFLLGIFLPGLLWQTVVQQTICILALLSTCVLDVRPRHGVWKGGSECAKFLSLSRLNS